MKPDTPSSGKSLFAPTDLVDRPDRELVQAWKGGDQGAADVLWRRYTTRLIGLVANRVAKPYRDSIAPEEVVQSAWGSFFHAAKQSRLQISETLSLWHLLALFAQRKLARRFEQSAAAKRGGQATRLPLEAIEAAVAHNTACAAELQDWIETELDEELRAVLARLMAGCTQREIADELSIDERRVRRRVQRLRKQFSGEEGTVSSPPDPSLPKHLPRISYGEFVLGGLVGSGAFGKVYRASLQASGEQVAVKFLRKVFWQTGSVRAAFLREIELASQIDHRGVLRYRGWGLSPHGGPYIVSDWIDGTTLAQTPGSDRSTVIDARCGD
ncbi:MAG: ECF-type sigma factor, partial [Planctomycetota bacterium]